MGLFGPKKKKATGNSGRGRVCPRHGRFNSYICDQNCVKMIDHANGREAPAQEEDVHQDRGGFW